MTERWSRCLAVCRERIDRTEAPVRWLFLGAAVLAAVLMGGAITAYGGIFLVLFLFVLCQAGMWYLLDYAGRSSVGEKAGWRSEAFRRAFLIAALAGLALLAGLIFYRRTIYVDDYINYWSKQDLLMSGFAENGFYGVHILAESLLTADYKMFANLFISGPYLFTNRSIEAFMLCMYLCCVVPAMYAMLLVAQRIGEERADGIYLTLCGLCMAVWPMLMFTVSHGMPDMFGLAFVGIILLLCWDYRFESLPVGRLTAVFAATFCLILTRRWYLYWVVAFYGVYVLMVLADAARRRNFLRVFRNMAVFGGLSMVGIVVPLFLTFRNILSTDYADIYGDYYGGGFLVNLKNQLHYQGALWLVAVAVGLILLLRQKHFRWPVVCLSAATLTAFILFVRTQSLGEHQSLLLAPLYLAGLYGLLAAFRKRSARAAVMAVTTGILLCNLGAGIGILPRTVLTTGMDMDTTRRNDFAQIQAVADFVLENCTPEETAYLNIDSGGYNGNTFRYSGDKRLRELIVWESSVPSVHGFPTGIWDSKYVMVTDQQATSPIVAAVNQAILTDTPASTNYVWVCDFPLEGTTLHCYQRIGAPTAEEAAYYLQQFAEFDERWPELYSQRINEYLTAQ